MGLLDGLLGALAGQAMRTQTGAGGLGGLGDLLSGARGGRGGANLVTALLPALLMLLQSRGSAGGAGGLGGLLQQFQGAGLGSQVDSWVGTGANMPLSPEQVIDALGHDQVAQIASRAGVSEADASGGLAALLPEFVNQLTPAGQMPAESEVGDALGDLQRSLGI